MGRPKGSTNGSGNSKPKYTGVTNKYKGKTPQKAKGLSTAVTQLPVMAVAKAGKYKCTCCGSTYDDQEKNFYQSSSLSMLNNNKRMSVCKECLIKLFDFMCNKFGERKKLSLYFVCSIVDAYFDALLYESTLADSDKSNASLVGSYFRIINSFPQYNGRTFADSTLLDVRHEITKDDPLRVNKKDTQSVDGYTIDEVKNKEDVIRMVGYDPFENENALDKKALYNRLVDFLDESTLEDSFKLPIVIEIVKTFNQLDKINQSLAVTLADPSQIANQSAGIKQMMETKDKIYRSILAMAKDNGISVNHSTTKSAGAGTLSGIIKKLQELDFNEIDINIYDVETCAGIRQVADISNKSILTQLQFDENSYVDMIKEQRSIIEDLRSKYENLEEEVRLYKIKLKDNEIEGI